MEQSFLSLKNSKGNNESPLKANQTNIALEKLAMLEKKLGGIDSTIASVSL